MNSAILLLQLSLITLALFAQKGNFVSLRFPSGIQLDVPRNWTFLNDNIKNAIQASSEAMIDLTNSTFPKAEQNILVAANGYSTLKEAAATLRLSTRKIETLSQREVLDLSESEINEFGIEQKKQITRLLSAQDPGASIKWHFVKLQRINGLGVITMQYTRTSSKHLSFRVQIDMIPDSRRLITLTTSFYEDERILWNPIIERVRYSLRLR